MSDNEHAVGAEQRDDAAPDDDLLDDQADAAEDFINGLLDALDMDGEAEADIADETIEVRVAGPDMGLLIGRHGSTLEALQELTRAAVQHQTASRARLVLDIEGYRDRQRAMHERQARATAAMVRKTRRPVELEPMTSFERKVVHSALADFDGVRTASEGDEPDRKVVIYPV
ncbi:MAG TPA: R3H domain-containing nucleic acid-binding protein [Actinomycetota bacterium]|nr:R3H domain-containing nucleic acid-binding protein [Actinomycetota bacterium]